MQLLGALQRNILVYRADMGGNDFWYSHFLPFPFPYSLPSGNMHDEYRVHIC